MCMHVHVQVMLTEGWEMTAVKCVCGGGGGGRWGL